MRVAAREVGLIKTKGILPRDDSGQRPRPEPRFYTTFSGSNSWPKCRRRIPFRVLNPAPTTSCSPRHQPRRFSDIIHHASWSTAMPTCDGGRTQSQGRGCVGRINATKASSPAQAYFHDPDNNALEIIHLTTERRLRWRQTRAHLRLRRCTNHARLEGRQRTPEGIELTVLTDMVVTRHWRFLRGREFELAEVSGSGYVAARDQDLPFARFRFFPIAASVMASSSSYVEGHQQADRPYGRRSAPRATCSPPGCGCGILEHDYGVPHNRSSGSVSSTRTLISRRAGPQDHAGAADKSLEDMLVEGEIDALLSPDLIRPLTAAISGGRLFPNYKEEEIAFYRRTAFFRSCTSSVSKQEMRAASVGGDQLYKAFDEAKALAMKRMENPRIVPLAGTARGGKEQEHISRRPLEYGLTERNAGISSGS